MGAPRGSRRRPRSQDIAAAGVVLAAGLCLTLLVGFFLIETQFRPTGSAFGLPARIPLCGRSFLHSPENTKVFTKAEIEAGMTPGYSPIILEPSLGEIPLLAIFEPHPIPQGGASCDVAIFLHTGDDTYVGYSLEGGP